MGKNMGKKVDIFINYKFLEFPLVVFWFLHKFIF